MNVLFWIRKSIVNNKGEAPLYFRITIDGEKSKEKSTGIKIIVTDWQASFQRCKSNQYANTQIMLITNKLQQIHSYLELSGQLPSVDLVLKHFYGQALKRYPILTLYDMFLQHCEDINISASKKGKAIPIHPDTIKVYRYKRKHLVAYLASLNNEIFGDEITATFCENYTEWLEYNYSVFLEKATIARCITCLKKTITYAFKKGYIANNSIKDYIYSRGEDKTPLSLSIEQINSIWVYPFASQILQQTADMFILQVLTGFDYEDIKNFTIKNITTYGHIEYIEYKRSKNGQAAIIPLHEGVRFICEKYSFLWPKISLIHFNRYLKDIAKLTNIEMRLTAKVGRKTFSDIKVNEELYTPATVSRMLGHLKPDTLTKYYARVKNSRVINEENKRRNAT